MNDLFSLYPGKDTLTGNQQFPNRTRDDTIAASTNFCHQV